jgi:flavin reductase (DIM6/NTAB) family NADH-FMN oxidoreductase RutF
MDQFKQGMRQLAGAVTVVTAGKHDDIAGLTATAVCSLTADPPRLLACLNMNGVTFELLRRHGRFCVNVIGEDDLRVAEAFAGMGHVPPTGKFGVGEWEMAEDRAPRLRSALVAFECKVHSVTMLSTHGLAIGDVTAVHVAPHCGPLLYHDGQFAGLAGLLPA